MSQSVLRAKWNLSPKRFMDSCFSYDNDCFRTLEDNGKLGMVYKLKNLYLASVTLNEVCCLRLECTSLKEAMEAVEKIVYEYRVD